MPSPRLAAALIAMTAANAFAQQPPAGNAANEQVVVPQVERREVRIPKFPSRDFSVSLFAGTYATENFGSAAVGGLRVGYHITEDFFAEATFGQTKVSDEAFRQVLPGGVFPTSKETLSYYNLSAGYNVLPGEIFIGRNVAKASALYVVLGVGSTKFFEQKKQTINVGFGFRVLFTDRFQAQLDVRNHSFSLDLLGKQQSTQNPEITAGVSFFF